MDYLEAPIPHIIEKALGGENPEHILLAERRGWHDYQATCHEEGDEPQPWADVLDEIGKGIDEAIETLIAFRGVVSMTKRDVFGEPACMCDELGKCTLCVIAELREEMGV